jgi:hypothetical protein
MEPLLESTRITTHTVANMLRISFRPVQNIQNDNLNLCHVAAKSVPHLPKEQQNIWLNRK